MAADPSKDRAEVAEMKKYAAVCDAVDGGTEDMRALGKAYLPKWKNEEEEDWKARLDCTTLFPAFAKTLDTMVGRPFGEPIALDGPSTILAHTENIDLTGRDLDTFCRDAFRAALRDGITWILVDYPPVAPAPNLAAERAAGVRPYWVHIPLERIIGWKTATTGGKVTLTQLRYWECVEVEPPDDPWGVAEDKRVRILTPGAFQVWVQRGEKKEWVMIEEGLSTLQEIPLTAVYTGREGFFTAEPPLSDLAWENVAHWQSSSDQRNILHKARVPFLAADGDNRSDPNAEVEFKAGIFVGFENLHAVSFDSEPIAAGRQDLLDIEDRMRRIAGEALSSEVEKTAKQSGLEAKEGGSRLKAWVGSFQDALEQCFVFHGKWAKESTPVTVTINREWDDEALTADILNGLSTMRSAGQVTQRVLSHNLQEAGRFPEGWTLEDELAELESEGPALMTTLPLVKPNKTPTPA